MHCIIERMEYLFPPLSYLTHHSALSGLLNLSQTLLVGLVRDLTPMPWWPVLPGVDVRCKIFLWMFWKVKPQKCLTRYMWRKTFTSGKIIRFITTCTYFILSFIFGVVDISNFFINLVKVSKVWLKKNVVTTLSNGGSSSFSLCYLSRASPLTRTLYTDGLYAHCVSV